MTNEKSLTLKQIWNFALKGISEDLARAFKSIFLFCISLASLQFVFTYGPLILLPKPIDENILLAQRIFEALWGIALAIIYSIIVPYAVYVQKGHYKGLTLSGFFTKHFKLVSIETLRTLPQIIMYAVLLVVPGLVKMIRLIFVPLIVQLYRPYQSGQVDALKESDRLTQGAFAGIASFYFFSQLLIVFVVMVIPSYLQTLWALEPGSLENLTLDFVFNVPIGVIIELASSVGLLKIFEQIVIFKEGKDELAF